MRVAVLTALAMVVVGILPAASRGGESGWWERCEELPANQIEECLREGNGEKPERSVCLSVSGECAIRPHIIPYGAHAALRHVRWRGWGENDAIGTGELKYGATVTEPAFGPYAAKIVLSEVAKCQGALWYSRQTIKVGPHYRRTLERNEAIGPCYGYY
jgi:hypothetical protein